MAGLAPIEIPEAFGAATVGRSLEGILTDQYVSKYICNSGPNLHRDPLKPSLKDRHLEGRTWNNVKARAITSCSVRGRNRSEVARAIGVLKTDTRQLRQGPPLAGYSDLNYPAQRLLLQ